MRDTPPTVHPLLNRRFIRLQAVQRLYAFYACKQANDARALDTIRDLLVPDVFDDPLIEKGQQAQETQQALALFASSIAPASPVAVTTIPSSSRVRNVVAQTLSGYRAALSQDTHTLEGGLQASVVKINQACVRIWQLLVEWMHIAQQQCPQTVSRKNPTLSGRLAHSGLLQRLGNEEVLPRLVRENEASWEHHRALVVRWYHQFVQADADVQHYLVHPMTPARDELFVRFLVEDIIFKQAPIRDFFSNLDLRWETHASIVKRLVRQGLACFVRDAGHAATSRALGLLVNLEPAQHFYTHLVRTTLQYDADLEQLITKKAKNWTYDRIALLDKTVLKLASCELLHLDDIPVKVSINEYVELAKLYGTPKSGPFVNGLLDAVAATLRDTHVPGT